MGAPRSRSRSNPQPEDLHQSPQRSLLVVDFTYVHTRAGFVYVAFVIDAFAGGFWGGR